MYWVEVKVGVVGMGRMDTTYNSTSILGTCNDNEILDPVGSTARYKVMKLCIYWVSIGQQWLVLAGI